MWYRKIRGGESLTSQISLNKKHYNAVILLASFANRLHYKQLMENELFNSNEDSTKQLVESLEELRQYILSNGQLSSQNQQKALQIHEQIVQDFSSFYNLVPISQTDKISAIYASFMAEKQLHEQLAALHLVDDAPKSNNKMAQIAFYDEQLTNLNKAVQLIKQGYSVNQEMTIQIDRWYQNLLSIKQHLFGTLDNLHLLLIDQ